MTYPNLNKVLILSFLFILGIIDLQAQQEIEFYPGGIVFPRIDSMARETLSPVIGQFIYNIDTERLNTGMVTNGMK